MEEGWCVTEARIDWITATCRTTSPSAGFTSLASEVMEVARKDGNDVEAASWNGYRGTRTRGVFLGFRMDGACLQLGGRMAGAYWNRAVKEGTNVTRLDLAVTTKVGSDPGDWIDTFKTTVLRRDWGRGPKPHYTYIEDLWRGKSLYCGRRVSERFGRIYDKYWESKGDYPKGTIRWEIEYKGDVVPQVLNQFVDCDEDSVVIQRIVAARFHTWGINIPWFDEQPPIVDTFQRQRTDDASREKWLRNQVRQVVGTMGERHSSADLREMLGLATT